MLDERKAAILRAVVEEYIETADPVGSARVAQAAGVQVSSATVRNEMAVLEREGYLVQPHTSAGRVPTDKGYRFFVDTMAGPGHLQPAQRQQVTQFFAKAHGQLEQTLHDTSKLLSNLTDYAAVIVGPSHEVATVRSVQLVGLSARTALLVAVLSNAVVEKRTVDFTDDLDDGALATASADLARLLVGRTLAELPTLATDNLSPLAATALAGLAGARHEDEPDHVFVGGVARMAQAFDAVETVRDVLRTLEQQYLVVGLLRDLIDRGLSVAIGVEHGVQPLAECSVVVAPFGVDGEQLGSIGVLGPTRMHYPEALAAVAVVSQQLGRRLSES
ncbi:MAG TPA: heat-inducible transcriptional repressor HrcA [Acidimicrobiales bacterium]|nr:heat-inducible transcriptional repressor HrcA [Acidimicrobiales bacterium]